MPKRPYAFVDSDSVEELLVQMDASMGDPGLFKAVLEKALPADIDARIVDKLASMSLYVPKPAKKVAIGGTREFCSNVLYARLPKSLFLLFFLRSK